MHSELRGAGAYPSYHRRSTLLASLSLGRNRDKQAYLHSWHNLESTFNLIWLPTKSCSSHHWLYLLFKCFSFTVSMTEEHSIKIQCSFCLISSSFRQHFCLLMMGSATSSILLHHIQEQENMLFLLPVNLYIYLALAWLFLSMTNAHIM